MARVFEGRRTFLHPVLRWLEVLTYKAAGIKEDVEQRWTTYTASLLSFSLFGFLLLYLMQRVQGFLPLNPQHFGASNVPPDLAFNTASSFVTNTNWQAYTRRIDHELFCADGRAGGTELRVRGCGHCRRRRADPRICVDGKRKPSATFGSM